jgi:hypothetical protein
MATYVIAVIKGAVATQTHHRAAAGRITSLAVLAQTTSSLNIPAELSVYDRQHKLGA